MSFVNLVVNESKLQYFELKQYWFETVSATIMMCAVFVGLFFGVKSYSGGGEADSLDGLVFGFLLWVFAISAYSSVTKSLIEDNQKGFLEQLFLCPHGFTKLMMARCMVEVFFSIAFITPLAFITMALTGNWLELNFLHFYLLMFLAAPSLVGLGLIISGLTINFKRVSTVGALFNIGFMGMVAVDALPFNGFSLLPFTPGASLARDVVLEHQPLDMTHLAIVAANSFVYLSIGLLIYKLLENRAKKHSLIGQY